MPFVSDIIYNLESILELRKIIQQRESYYAFLFQVKENGMYSHLLQPFKKNSVIRMHEAKEFLNHLLEYIMASKYGYNYITYDKEGAEAIVSNVDPENFHIINDSTVAVFLEEEKIESNKFNLKKISCLHCFSSPKKVKKKNFFLFYSFIVVFFAIVMHLLGTNFTQSLGSNIF